MGMGGNTGATQSPTDRASAAYAAGIKDPNELYAISRGLTPMTYTNYNNARQLALGNRKVGDPGAYYDVNKYGMQMANLANGGLTVRAGKELASIPDTNAITQGAMERTAARFGVDPSSGDLDTSVTDAAAKVAADNSARDYIARTQMGLRLGGIQV